MSLHRRLIMGRVVKDDDGKVRIKALQQTLEYQTKIQAVIAAAEAFAAISREDVMARATALADLGSAADELPR